MLRRLYDWTLEKAGHRYAERWLAFISFVESSVFPIPPDVLLAPMCLSRPERAWRYAFICTAASVAGALLGYAIGLFLFETVGQWVLSIYGLEEQFAEFRGSFNENGWIIVLLAGFTPLPFKVVTIASGATGLPIAILVLASIISRAGRFYLVAALLWKFGPPMKRLIDKHFGLFTAAFGILLVGGFLALKYLI